MAWDNRPVGCQEIREQLLVEGLGTNSWPGDKGVVVGWWIRDQQSVRELVTNSHLGDK